MNLRTVLTSGTLAAALISTALFMGCKIDSADSVTRNVRIHVAGLYRGGLNGRVISQHTGAAITQLNVIQDGDRLQAIDNNGLIFRGTIGSASGESATFNLKGRTTAGEEGILSGSITVSGNRATMRGTWAEPTLFGNVLAFATVTPAPEPEPGPTNGTPTNAQNTATNPSISF